MNPPDDTGGARPARRGGIVSVLARPQFALLTVGQTVSQLGDRLHNMAMIGLIDAVAAVSTTGIEVSKMMIATASPTVLAPVVGVLVDRWNKRFTMVACDFMRAIIVAFIPLLYLTSGYIWPVYIAGFFVGLIGVFFNAAKMSLIPDLVEHDDLLPANAALSTIGRLATVTGIVGGSVIVSWSIWPRFGLEGWEAGFYLDSLSYAISVFTLVAIALLSRVAVRRQRGAHPVAESADVVKRKVAGMKADVLETFRLIRSHHGLRFVFLMVVVLGALAGSIANILSAATLAVLDAGTRGVGVLGGLLAGGLIPGSLVVGTVGARWDKRWMMVFGCLTMGLFMVAGSIWFSYAIFLPISFVGGMVLAPVMVSMDTLLHEWAPRGSRALVFSTRDLVLGVAFATFNGAAAVTVALLGSVARTPYAVTLFIFGLVVIVGTLVAAATQLRMKDPNRSTS